VVIPLSDRVPRRASGPFRSRIDDGGSLQYVFWKINRALKVFSSRKIYRRKGDVRGGPGAHTIAWCGLGVARAMAWCGRPLAPLHLYFGLCLVSEKIENLDFASSNSENISYVAFLKHKNSRKQGTGTVASH
jgi:hypothetical protein